MSNQIANNKAVALNQNQKISYQCYSQQCGQSEKCIQNCFIFSKILFIIRIYQEILSQKADPKQILVYLEIKKCAQRANNLKIQNGTFTEPKNIPITQIYQFNYHMGKGKEKQFDKICPFCIRSYDKSKIQKHQSSHKSIPFEKYQINGLQSYQRICKCLICSKKIMINQWAKHLHGQHIDDLVYFCMKQRLHNPIMPPGWYYSAIHLIATKPNPRQVAAKRRNIKYGNVEKMNQAKGIKKREQMARYSQPILLSDPDSGSEAPYTWTKVKPNWGLPFPSATMKIPISPQYQQQQILKEKQRKQQERKREIMKQKKTKQAMKKLDKFDQQLSMKVIKQVVNRQFFRTHLNKYKCNYPRDSQSFLCFKILKQWDVKTDSDIINLWNMYKRQKSQEFMQALQQILGKAEGKKGSSESSSYSQVQQPSQSEQQQQKPSNGWKQANSQQAQLMAFCASSQKQNHQKMTQEEPCKAKIAIEKQKLQNEQSKERLDALQQLNSLQDKSLVKKIIRRTVYRQFFRIKYAMYKLQNYQQSYIIDKLLKQWEAFSNKQVMSLWEEFKNKPDPKITQWIMQDIRPQYGSDSE